MNNILRWIYLIVAVVFLFQADYIGAAIMVTGYFMTRLDIIENKITEEK